MEFFRKPLTITRHNPGSRDSKGRYVPNIAPTFSVTVNASVQSLTSRSAHAGDQFLFTSLGAEYLDGAKLVLSSQALYTADKAGTRKADRFTYDGQLYEIRSVSPKGALLPHWHCVATLVDEKTA